jgi:hypothetical protein
MFGFFDDNNKPTMRSVTADDVYKATGLTPGDDMYSDIVTAMADGTYSPTVVKQNPVPQRRVSNQYSSNPTGRIVDTDAGYYKPGTPTHSTTVQEFRNMNTQKPVKQTGLGGQRLASKETPSKSFFDLVSDIWNT